MRREAEEAESDEEKEALLREANDTTQRFSILFDSSTYQVSDTVKLRNPTPSPTVTSTSRPTT